MSTRGENIRNNISADYEKTPGYLLWDISEAVGQEMDIQDAELAGIRSIFDVDNLEGDMLERAVRQRRGLERKAATYAVGILEIIGSGNVNQGDLFETENGVQFRATETAEIMEAGSVAIEAIEPGNVGVVGANTITQMPVTLAGIVSCNNPEPTHDGYDAETDDSLRQRYYAKLRTPDSGANKYAYRNWAMEVPGVGDAQVHPLGHGDNTVDVVIINTDKLPASPDLVADVQEYIDPGSSGRGEGAAMMGAHCYVSSATGLEINLTGKLIINAQQADVEAAVKQSVKSYLASIAYSGYNISYAQINNAVLETAGVLDVENLKINDGIANIEVPDRSVGILGTAVFDYA